MRVTRAEREQIRQGAAFTDDPAPETSWLAKVFNTVDAPVNLLVGAGMDPAQKHLLARTGRPTTVGNLVGGMPFASAPESAGKALTDALYGAAGEAVSPSGWLMGKGLGRAGKLLKRARGVGRAAAPIAEAAEAAAGAPARLTGREVPQLTAGSPRSQQEALAMLRQWMETRGAADEAMRKFGPELPGMRKGPAGAGQWAQSGPSWEAVPEKPPVGPRALPSGTRPALKPPIQVEDDALRQATKDVMAQNPNRPGGDFGKGKVSIPVPPPLPARAEVLNPVTSAQRAAQSVMSLEPEALIARVEDEMAGGGSGASRQLGLGLRQNPVVEDATLGELWGQVVSEPQAGGVLARPRGVAWRTGAPSYVERVGEAVPESYAKMGRVSKVVKDVMKDVPAGDMHEWMDAAQWLDSRGLLQLSEKLRFRASRSGMGLPEFAEKFLINRDDYKALSVFDQVRIVGVLERRPRIARSRFYSRTMSASKQNTKQFNSVVFEGDTSPGCHGFCVECYANALTRQSLTSHGFPIDIDQFKGVFPMFQKWSGRETFLRLGVTGDSAHNWKKSAEVMRDLIQRTNTQRYKMRASFERGVKVGLKKRPVERIDFDPARNLFAITKLRTLEGFDPEVFRNLHVSLDPIYPDHMKTAMENVVRLRKMHPNVKIALRIRSYDSNNPLLARSQEAAVEFARRMDLPVLETRMRFAKKAVAELLDLNLYDKTKKTGTYIRLERGKLFPRSPILKGRIKPERYFVCDKAGGGCASCTNCLKVFGIEPRNLAREAPSPREWRQAFIQGGRNPSKRAAALKAATEHQRHKVRQLAKVGGSFSTMAGATLIPSTED